MLLEFLLFFSLIVTFIYMFLYKKKPKKYRFIGFRNTGKTRVINYLVKESYKTVPTLEKYSVSYKNCIIEELPEQDGKFFTRFGIDDPNYTYFMFLRDPLDAKDIDSGCFDIKFVYFGKRIGMNSNIIYLEDNPGNIIKYL